MKYAALLAILIMSSCRPRDVATVPVQVCTNDYALCAATNCTPAKGEITINTMGTITTWQAADCLCPILRGPSVSSPGTGNMPEGNKCVDPVVDGKTGVWSAYSIRKNIPQAPDWKHRTTASPYVCDTLPEGMAQCYSFACSPAGEAIGPDGKPTGVMLASCKCPINETPNGQAVDVATTPIITQAATCNLPVGGPAPEVTSKAASLRVP